MSREAKNEHKVRKMLTLRGYSNPQKVIDAIRNDIPNVRLPKDGDNERYKFLEGVTRMYMDGELKTAEVIMNVNQIIPLICDSHLDEYDYDLNGLTATELINRFKSVVHENRILDEERSRSIERVRNTDYEIIRCNSFADAEKFKDYTSWCITTSENMFNSYTKNGLGLFYILAKKGFEHMNGSFSQYDDEYAKSLIAVSITMDGSLNTCTSRFNHSCGCNDSFMTVPEIEELLGMSFYDACPKRSKEELRAMGVSENIGKLYKIKHTDIMGICVQVDENENPKVLMDVNWTKNDKDDSYIMTWYDANEMAEKSKWGQLPSKEMLEATIKWRDVINSSIDHYNDRLEAGEKVEDMWIEYESPKINAILKEQGLLPEVA